VECKNWSNPVDAKEIKLFELKMLNHKRRVNLGIFVAANGFTNTVDDSLRRASARGECQIVLLTLEDVIAYVESTRDLLNWLEDHIVRQY
jgi:Restriction endonuclease